MTNRLNSQDIKAYEAKLHELRIEHRDLDQVIQHLTQSPPPDQLLVPRLKKRKLHLKDLILEIEALLIPDEPA